MIWGGLFFLKIGVVGLIEGAWYEAHRRRPSHVTDSGEFLSVLRPGSEIVLCSVRDYERIDRADSSTIRYGTRWRVCGLMGFRPDGLQGDDAHYDES